MSPLSFSLVLPCFNEEANIERTVLESLAWMKQTGIDGEIVVVNDGSADRSQEILDRLAAANPALKLVRHPVNRGYGAALTSGFDAATKELAGFMDSDGQFEAKDFDRLFPFIGEYQFVTGVRATRADSLPRLLNALLYKSLLRFVLHVRTQDINCAMKVFRRELWPRLRPHNSTGALFNAEVFFALNRLGIPWKEVPVPHYPRRAGTPSGANIWVILRMFRELYRLKRRVGE